MLQLHRGTDRDAHSIDSKPFTNAPMVPCSSPAYSRATQCLRLSQNTWTGLFLGMTLTRKSHLYFWHMKHIVIVPRRLISFSNVRQCFGASEAQVRSKQVLAIGASAHAHRDTHLELPQDLNTPSAPPYTQPPINFEQSRGTSGASAHAHTDTQPELAQDLNTSSAPLHTPINFEQSLGTSGASAHAHTDTQPELARDLNTSNTQSQIDLRQSLGTLHAPAYTHTDSQLWSTQVQSLGTSTQIHAQQVSRERPVYPISYVVFGALVQDLAGQQLQPEVCYEGPVMRGIAFRHNNVEVGYWSMSGDLAPIVQTLLSLLTYTPT
jgi:hypothetical protein